MAIRAAFCLLVFCLLAAPLMASGRDDREKPLRPATVLLDKSPLPGTPVRIITCGYRGDQALPRATLSALRGKQLSAATFFRTGITQDGMDILLALLPVPLTAPTGQARIDIEGGTPETGNREPMREFSVDIQERAFPREVIRLEKEKADLLTKSDPRKTEESRILSEVLLSVNPRALWDSGPFCRPTDATRRTSAFGFTREYRYPDDTSGKSIHWGLDLALPRGSPVTASGTGIVVLARSRIVTGNTIVIEHLGGVYSLYYHLDTILVTEGSPVGEGDLIALSGNTGLSTGPHLHWEFRINGEAMDPEYLTRIPLLDKDLFLAKMRTDIDR